MTDYDNLKQNILMQRSFGNIKGIPLVKDRGKKGWFPILPCICVKAEGCPCDTFDDIIILLPSTTMSEATGDKYEEDEIYSYNVDRTDKILVETLLPMSLGQLEKTKEIVENGSRKAKGFMQKSSSTIGKPTTGGLLIGAFELGWYIGTKIDESGEADFISDWMAENFPWPWP